MRRKGWWKITLVVLLLLIAAMFATDYFFVQHLKEKVNGVDGIQVEKVDGSLIWNNIGLSSILIEKQAKMGFRGQVERIEIEGVDRLEFINSGNIDVSSVVIDEGELYVDMSSPTKASHDSIVPSKIIIGDFAVRNTSVHILNKKDELANVHDVSLRIEGLKFKADSGFSLEDYFIRTGMISIKPKGNHSVQIKSMSYELDQQLAQLSDVQYFSLISKENWFEKVKKKESRIEFRSRKIEVFRPDFMALLNESDIDIGKIVVHNALMEVYEDKRFAHCSNCIVKLPQQSLLDANYGINIDSIQIKNSSIVYLARERNKSQLGELEFSKLYTSIYHLSNRPTIIANHPHLLIDAKAYIFESTSLDLHVNFDLLNPKGGYTFNGMLGGFELVRLNDFLAPVKHVTINDGRSFNSTFRARGSQYSTSGDMRFAYQNLKLEFLSKDENSKRFMSGLLNELAIKCRNVDGDQFRQGIVYHRRDRSRSIFHSLSQSLQSGIKSTVLSKHLLPAELRIKRK